VRCLTAAFATAALAACGGGEVVVQAQLESEEGTPTPLRELEVRALPYDRDALFEELAAAYGQPEPQIPDSLVALQQEIAATNTRWQEATTRWNTARDSLKVLSDALQGISPASGAYRVMFGDYTSQEQVEQSAKRQMDDAFAEFQGLQDRYTSQAEETEARRLAWADEAYASIDSVIAARLDEMGLEEHADTTTENGIARFELEPGQWWFHARYDLPYEELYWNVPIEVTRGEPVQVTLNGSTAARRPKF
jgi:hypothetical protein